MINETYIYVILILQWRKERGDKRSRNCRFPYFNKYLFYNIKCQDGEQVEMQTELKIPI